jgi:hypothetical protein
VAARRMNRKRILNEVRKSGSFRGGSGVDRKALFVRPTKVAPLKCHVLPDLQKRGATGELLPYLTLTTHWMTRERQDGSTFMGGITCYQALKEDEPFVHERVVEKKLIGEKDRCLTCAILETTDPEDLPKDNFGKGPAIAGRKSFHFQVIPERGSGDEGGPLKVLSSGLTGMQSFMEQVCDEDFLEDGHFEEHGIWSTWRALGQSWQVQLDPRKVCWLDDWQEQMLDLDLIVPVFMSLEEHASTLMYNLPQYRDVIEKMALGKAVPKAKPKPAKKPDAKASRTRAKKRITKAS